MDALVNIEIVWRKESPSGLPCAVCNEYIFSNEHRLYVNINSKQIDSDVVVCETCHELIKKDAIH